MADTTTTTEDTDIFARQLSTCLVDCAAARTAREFSAAADRLDQLGLRSTTHPAQRRQVREAAKQALQDYLARTSGR